MMLRLLAVGVAGATITAVPAQFLSHVESVRVDVLATAEAAGLITFSHVITQQQGMPPDLQLVMSALANVRPEGGTALIDATFVGLSVAEHATGRGLVILFSDGVDTMSWQTSEQVLGAARRFETVLYGISAAPQGNSLRFLRDIAAATGGEVLELAANRGLHDAFANILQQFRQRYLLSCTPTGVSKAGWHRIDVRVKRPGVTVRARPGYFAN